MMTNPKDGSSKSTDQVSLTLIVVTEKWVSRGTTHVSKQHIMQLMDVAIIKEQVTTEGNFIPLDPIAVPIKPIGHMEIKDDD